jgi:hypothetical protein
MKGCIAQYHLWLVAVTAVRDFAGRVLVITFTRLHSGSNKKV